MITCTQGHSFQGAYRGLNATNGCVRARSGLEHRRPRRRAADAVDCAQHPDLDSHCGYSIGHPGLLCAVPLADLAACVVFAAAGITDTLDGYLARKLGQITRLGAFLDPVADKLIVATALVLLVARDPRVLVVLMAVVIIGREIAISALREWMAELGQRRKVAVSVLGKYKTIFQVVGLSMMFYRSPLWGLDIYRIGVGLTVLAAVLTLVSMVSYMRAAWPICAHKCLTRLDIVAAPPTIPPPQSGGGCLAREAGIAQLVERNLAKVEVASSSLVSRSKLRNWRRPASVAVAHARSPPIDRRASLLAGRRNCGGR